MATSYIILASSDAGSRWNVMGKEDGASAQGAIRSFLSNGKDGPLVEDGDGTYVAIPARSWQPVPVKVETTLKFG